MVALVEFLVALEQTQVALVPFQVVHTRIYNRLRSLDLDKDLDSLALVASFQVALEAFLEDKIQVAWEASFLEHLALVEEASFLALEAFLVVVGEDNNNQIVDLVAVEVEVEVVEVVPHLQEVLLLEI